MYVHTEQPYLWGNEKLCCSLESIQLDGSNLEGFRWDSDQKHLDLHDETDWQALGMTLFVRDPEDDLEQYLPAGGVHAVKCMIRCSSTRMRRAVSMEVCEGGWRGHTTLKRDECKGEVEIEAFSFLEANVSTAIDENRATRRGERIASAPLVKLHLDNRPPVPGQDIRSRWENFGDSGLDDLKDRKDSLSYMDLADIEDPFLHLNRGVSGFENLLMNVKEKKGVNAMARDAIALQVKTGVLQTWCAAVLSNAASMENPVEDLGERSRGLLIDMAKNSIGSESDETKIRKWCENWNTGDRLYVLQQIDGAIHRKLSSAKTVGKLCKEIEGKSDD